MIYLRKCNRLFVCGGIAFNGALPSNSPPSYLISVFFNRTTMAALTGLIVYLISYLPFVVLILPCEKSWSSGTKSLW